MTVAAMKPTVIDLDALRPAEGEATGAPLEVVFAGERYTVPRELPYEALRAARADDLEGAVTAMMGPDQAERFLASPGLTLQDMLRLFQALVKADTGATAGESSGSSTSSRNTTKR